DESVLGFRTEAELLTFIESDNPHDLKDHPEWEDFNKGPANRVSPEERDFYDLIGTPEFLAGRPSHTNISAVARNFQMADIMASVSAAQHISNFFASHSLLRNASSSLDHISCEQGMQKRTDIGRIVLTKRQKVIDELDEHVRIMSSTEFDEKKV